LSDDSNNRQNYQVDRAFGCIVDKFTISGGEGVIDMALDIKAHGMLQKANLINDASSGSAVVINLASAEGFVATDDVNIFDNTPQSDTAEVSALSLTAKTLTLDSISNSYTVTNSGKVELIPQTPSFTDDPNPFSFVHCSFQFGSDTAAAASSAEENVENWDLQYMNNSEERFGSLRNTPSVIAVKGNGAKISFTKYFENVADRDRYQDRAKRACILTISNNKIVSSDDTNNAKETIKFIASDVRFTSYDMPTGTDDLYAINAELELFHDSTDGRALRVEFTNGKSAAYYA